MSVIIARASLERGDETQMDQALVKKVASVLPVLPDVES
jgi:hypothetical protein